MPHAPRQRKVWLFDLDNTLHNASAASFTEVSAAMGDYIVRHLGLSPAQSDALRRRYWQRYGATLLGLIRHHAVDPHHFLAQTHQLPALEERVRGHRHDVAALARLPGRKFVLTNAPRQYSQRVLGALGLEAAFDGLLAVEDLRMFGHWRPKPDARTLLALCRRLRVAPSDCVLVEDALENLKAARRIGMGTVWMQRWLRLAHIGWGAGVRASLRPAYADRRVRKLSDLRRRTTHPE
jgi:putative hydrolase of the HAD superfamily